MNTHLLLTIASFHLLVLLIPAALAMLIWKPQSWLITLECCMGAVVGYISMNSHEPQLPATLLLLFGIFLGFMRPSRPWAPAILLAAWVPVAACGTLLVQGRMQLLVPQGIGSFLSFLFSFAGSSLGALIARRSPHAESDL